MKPVFILLLLLVTNISGNDDDKSKNMVKSSTLIVTSIKNPPFLMLKKNSEILKGNERYEGFIPDLLFELSKLNNFNYVITEVADARYGSVLEDGNWTGMAGELLSQDAHIAAADLTITSSRKEIVDFTVPFMTSGIGILGKKPDPPVMDPWFFIRPFSPQLWFCTLIAFLAITIFLFILGRFSGKDWNQSSPSEERENNLNITNSLYFVFASLVFQNSKIAPRGSVPRFLSCIWWAFSLILICCYLANMTAILVNKIDLLPQNAKIKNVEDLASQDKVKYGTVMGGSTFTFFKSSQLPLYQFMYDQMMNSDSPVFVSSYKEGVKKVLQGNYALFMEHTSISYLLTKYCEFEQIGDLLNYQSYGLALKKGDPYAHNLSVSILQLQETGVLHRLRDKWWGKWKNVCPEELDDTEVSLSVSSVGGVFIFLFVGFLIAIVIAAFDLLWKAKTNEGQGSLWNEVIRESKYALCGSGPNPKTNGNRIALQEDGISLNRQDEVVLA